LEPQKEQPVTIWHRSNLTKAELDNMKSQIVISSWELIHNPNFNYGEFAIIILPLNF